MSCTMHLVQTRGSLHDARVMFCGAHARPPVLLNPGRPAVGVDSDVCCPHAHAATADVLPGSPWLGAGQRREQRQAPRPELFQGQLQGLEPARERRRHLGLQQRPLCRVVLLLHGAPPPDLAQQLGLHAGPRRSPPAAGRPRLSDRTGLWCTPGTAWPCEAGRAAWGQYLAASAPCASASGRQSVSARGAMEVASMGLCRPAEEAHPQGKRCRAGPPGGRAPSTARWTCRPPAAPRCAAAGRPRRRLCARRWPPSTPALPPPGMPSTPQQVSSAHVAPGWRQPAPQAGPSRRMQTAGRSAATLDIAQGVECPARLQDMPCQARSVRAGLTLQANASCLSSCSSTSLLHHATLRASQPGLSPCALSQAQQQHQSCSRPC